ncbi:MAG: hypothetical protein DPW09_45215 [Anaerolineae bacterium]|nr:hypothetical protein [Anaerolineae bacterium]
MTATHGFRILKRRTAALPLGQLPRLDWSISQPFVSAIGMATVHVLWNWFLSLCRLILFLRLDRSQKVKV